MVPLVLCPNQRRRPFPAGRRALCIHWGVDAQDRADWHSCVSLSFEKLLKTPVLASPCTPVNWASVVFHLISADEVKMFSPSIRRIPQTLSVNVKLIDYCCSSIASPSESWNAATASSRIYSLFHHVNLCQIGLQPRTCSRTGSAKGSERLLPEAQYW